MRQRETLENATPAKFNRLRYQVRLDINSYHSDADEVTDACRKEIQYKLVEGTIDGVILNITDESDEADRYGIKGLEHLRLVFVSSKEQCAREAYQVCLRLLNKDYPWTDDTFLEMVEIKSTLRWSYVRACEVQREEAREKTS